eukprot:7816086-Pyramimonas_sp.AAC.1
MAASCVPSAPVKFLVVGAALHGAPLQRALAGARGAALVGNVHFSQPVCTSITVAITTALSPG